MQETTNNKNNQQRGRRVAVSANPFLYDLYRFFRTELSFLQLGTCDGLSGNTVYTLSMNYVPADGNPDEIYDQWNKYHNVPAITTLNKIVGQTGTLCLGYDQYFNRTDNRKKFDPGIFHLLEDALIAALRMVPDGMFSKKKPDQVQGKEKSIRELKPVRHFYEYARYDGSLVHTRFVPEMIAQHTIVSSDSPVSIDVRSFKEVRTKLQQTAHEKKMAQPDGWRDQFYANYLIANINHALERVTDVFLKHVKTQHLTCFPKHEQRRQVKKFIFRAVTRPYTDRGNDRGESLLLISPPNYGKSMLARFWFGFQHISKNFASWTRPRLFCEVRSSQLQEDRHYVEAVRGMRMVEISDVQNMRGEYMKVILGQDSRMRIPYAQDAEDMNREHVTTICMNDTDVKPGLFDDAAFRSRVYPLMIEERIDKKSFLTDMHAAKTETPYVSIDMKDSLEDKVLKDITPIDARWNLPALHGFLYLYDRYLYDSIAQQHRHPSDGMVDIYRMQKLAMEEFITSTIDIINDDIGMLMYSKRDALKLFKGEPKVRRLRYEALETALIHAAQHTVTEECASFRFPCDGSPDRLRAVVREVFSPFEGLDGASKDSERVLTNAEIGSLMRSAFTKMRMSAPDAEKDANRPRYWVYNYEGAIPVALSDTCPIGSVDQFFGQVRREYEQNLQDIAEDLDREKLREHVDRGGDGGGRYT